MLEEKYMNVLTVLPHHGDHGRNCNSVRYLDFVYCKLFMRICDRNHSEQFIFFLLNGVVVPLSYM